MTNLERMEWQKIMKNKLVNPVEKNNTVKISVMSDLHVLPTSMIAYTEDFYRAVRSDRKMLEESTFIFEEAIQKVKDQDSSLLLITGDLTKDAEYKGHEYVSKQLNNFIEEDESRAVYVIPGNHDITNLYSFNFNTNDKGVTSEAKTTYPHDFENLYHFVYGNGENQFYKDSHIFQDYLASVNKRYDRPQKNQYYAAGYLSYASRYPLSQKETNGVTIIALDTAHYSADNTKTHEDNIQNTEGSINQYTLSWALDHIEEAHQRKDVVLVLAHHALVPHFHKQSHFMAPYLLENWDLPFTSKDSRLNGKNPAQALAEAGVSYLFTGHMHAQDISKYDTKEGQRLYNIMTGSPVSYPSPIRHMTLTNALNNETPYHRLKIRSEKIESVSFVNANQEEVYIGSLQEHSIRGDGLITPDLMVSIVHYFIDIYAEQSLRYYLADQLGLPASELSQHLTHFLYRLGNKENPVIVPLKLPLIGTIYLHVYYDEIENHSEEGKKIGIDGRIALIPFRLMVREENVEKLIDNLLDQVDHLLNNTELLNRWLTEIFRALFDAQVIVDSDTGEGRTFHELVNVSYLIFLEGDEDPPQWMNNAIARLLDSNDNVLRDVYIQAIPRIGEILEDITNRLVLSPTVEDLIETDGKFRFFEKIVEKQLGQSIGETIVRFFTFESILKESISNSAAIEMFASGNQELGELVSVMTNEKIPDYKKYAYLEDNDTDIIVEFPEKKESK